MSAARPTQAPDTTSSLTKAQFIAQADAKAQQIEVSETILVPNVENQAEEIRALEAPSADEDEISATLDSLEEGVEEVEANPQAPFESNQPNPFGPANKIAKEYGLKVCGQG